jgi:hypothetical protein
MLPNLTSGRKGQHADIGAYVYICIARAKALPNQVLLLLSGVAVSPIFSRKRAWKKPDSESMLANLDETRQFASP